MTNFARKITDITALQKQWNAQDGILSKVKKYIVDKADMLLAFREEQATVYYNGNQLCNMTSPNFDPTISELFLPLLRSNILESRLSKNGSKYKYISEREWQDRANIKNTSYTFADVLTEIQSNIKTHETPESFFVSKLYKYSPLNPKNDSPIILLDIEAAFVASGEKENRIDLVFYHKEEKRLLFIEAKGFWDSRLFDKKNNAPEILSQMTCYKMLLNDPKEKENLKYQYNNVINCYNSLGNLNIPFIEDNNPLLGLLIFGFNIDDKKSDKMKKMLSILDSHQIKYYCVGDTRSITNNTLLEVYKKVKQTTQQSLESKN